MNIDLLSQMVYGLILENDSLSLPGLGCFVAEMVPATFTDRGYTINPPYRKLSFRCSGPSDTLLVDLYAASNNVDKQIAEKVLVEFLTELKAILFAKKTVVFPGLGRLRATRENNIFFVADEGLDIFPEGFSLEPLSLKARKESPEDINRTVGALESILNGPEPEPAESAPAESTPAESTPAESMPIEPTPTESTPIEQEPIESTPTESAPIEPAHTGTIPSDTPVKSRKIWRVIGITAAVAVAVAVVVIGGFIILAHTSPAFVDSLLYTEEELRIINFKL
ncbi:MAG: hypothetical protein SOZ21_01405 [Candidatus Cryptobacteroides sp.]|nr:hypothetical protein [Candidatus Cryptobacteroides sp.]